MKDWFTHDYHARQDAKIMRLLVTHGPTGYAVFWAVVEMLHVNDGALPHDVLDTMVAGALFTTREDVAKVIGTMHDVGLLYSDGPNVRSSRVDRNLMLRKDITAKRKGAASKRWDSADASALQKSDKRDANAMLLQDITLQDKTKKEEVEIVSALSRTRARFVAPSVEEVRSYMTERKADASQAERFVDHYTANGWRVGRNPMKDWRAAVRNWIKSEPQYAPVSSTNARSGVFRGVAIPAVGSNLWEPPERLEPVTPEQAEELRRQFEERLGQPLNVKLGSNT